MISAAVACPLPAMELPPDDDGEPLAALPSDDDGKTPRKRLRSSPGPAQTQRLQPAGFDLPEDVVNDELDDLFGDVATASPDKRHREAAKELRRRKMKTLVCIQAPPLQRS